MSYPGHTPRWRRYARLLGTSVRKDVDDELRFHMESRIEELMARGMNRDDAQAQAEAEFGSITTFRGELMSIDRRVMAKQDRLEMIRGALSDAAYAIRSLRRTPGVAIAILATLGLGVGANAAMFTMLHAVFLQAPAGVVAPGGIQRVWAQRTFHDGAHVSPVMAYTHYTAAAEVLGEGAQVAVYRAPSPTRFGATMDAPNAEVSFASSQYFAMVGARAERGRLFAAGEEELSGAAPVAVVSHAFWMRAMGGDPNVVGTSVVIRGTRSTIIGVMAEPFTGVDLDAADVWIPLAFMAAGRRSAGAWWKNPNVNGFTLLIRLAPSLSSREAEARLTAAFRRPGVGYRSDSNTVVRLGSIVAANGPGERAQEVRIALRLAAVATIVLLIACANVANLLLARALRRRRELAVRLALGMSRWRLMQLLVAESGVLAVGAALVALTVAYVGGSSLRRLLLPGVHWASSPVNWTVVFFALAVALAAGLLAGLVPALRFASPSLTGGLKSGAGGLGAHSSRLRAGLVIVQAALSVVLLVGAALFVRSLANIRALHIGFDAERLITATIGYDNRARAEDPTMPARFAELAARVQRVPGVGKVALATARPLYSFTWMSYYTDRDSLGSRQGWVPTVTGVSPGYFEASGTRLLRGSDFSSSASGSAAGSVIVNEETAKGLWPGADPIGQCMRFGSRTGPCTVVVGVAENTRESTILEKPEPQYYLDLGHLPPPAVKEIGGASVLMIRTDAGQAAAVTAAVRTLARDMFPGGVPDLVRLSDYLEPQYRPWRLGATLFSLFGGLALIVAVIGIYSTVSYGVNQRVHEFGVRMALGANVSDVLRMVVGGGLRMVAVGVGVGVVLALLAGRFVASLLYGVSPGDAVALAAVAVVLLAAGGLAALVPALRASRADPVAALRAE